VVVPNDNYYQNNLVGLDAGEEHTAPGVNVDPHRGADDGSTGVIVSSWETCHDDKSLNIRLSSLEVDAIV
jgi:hypothetical protein